MATKSALVGVCTIVLDHSRKNVLLGERLSKVMTGKLGLPGGMIEIGETLEEGSSRELLEETSLVTKTQTYIGAIREERKNEDDFIHFAFVCDNYTGTPTTLEPEKCKGWEWYPLDSLPENIVPGHRLALEIYLHPEDRALREFSGCLLWL